MNKTALLCSGFLCKGEVEEQGSGVGLAAAIHEFTPTIYYHPAKLLYDIVHRYFLFQSKLYDLRTLTEMKFSALAH